MFESEVMRSILFVCDLPIIILQLFWQGSYVRSMNKVCSFLVILTVWGNGRPTLGTMFLSEMHKFWL